VLYDELNKVDNLLVKFDSFVLSDVLLTVPTCLHGCDEKASRMARNLLHDEDWE
jgi:hypothetical protein